MLKEKCFYKDGLPINMIVANMEEYPIHFHDDLEVVYVLAGSVFLKNGYYTFCLKQGDVFVLNDNEIHSFYRTEEDNMVLLLQLDTSYFAQYSDDLRNCFFVTNTDKETDESLEVFREILARIMMEVLQKRHQYEHRVIENAHNLISCLISDFQYFAMEDGRFVNETKNKDNKVLAGRLRRITDYMYEHYARKLTLREIAEREHLSVFYLSRAIKEATGLGFQDLLSFIRVEESEKILLGTNKKIGAISEECGFSALRYYNKHFQRWFGMPPLEYRQKYAGKALGREHYARFEKYAPAVIEAVIQRRFAEIYSAYANDRKPVSRVVTFDVAGDGAERKPKAPFPGALFEKGATAAASRPYTLFKSLDEQVLRSAPFCMISTATPVNRLSRINNISVLVYNLTEESFCARLREVAGKAAFLDLIKSYEQEAEILIRLLGVSGNFSVTRYKMTRENVISACVEWGRGAKAPNKRQALLNSWRTLPGVETGEVAVLDGMNLRFALRGFSAELILIDRINRKGPPF